MKYLAVCAAGLLAISLAGASVPASAGEGGSNSGYGGSSSSGYSGSSSGYGGSSSGYSGSSGNCYKCPPARNYDSQEVLKKTKDIDRSQVINTESVVPSKRLIETNHLVIHENETRNIGTVQHNHTIIEKELILRKNNVDNKTVNTTVNLVEHKYNTERKRIVEEREIPGQVRDLRDCNCDNNNYKSSNSAPLRSYGMASGASYGSSSGRSSRY